MYFKLYITLIVTLLFLKDVTAQRQWFFLEPQLGKQTLKNELINYDVYKKRFSYTSNIGYKYEKEKWALTNYVAYGTSKLKSFNAIESFDQNFARIHQFSNQFHCSRQLIGMNSYSELRFYAGISIHTSFHSQNFDIQNLNNNKNKQYVIYTYNSIISLLPEFTFLYEYLPGHIVKVHGEQSLFGYYSVPSGNPRIKMNEGNVQSINKNSRTKIQIKYEMERKNDFVYSLGYNVIFSSIKYPFLMKFYERNIFISIGYEF